MKKIKKLKLNTQLLVVFFGAVLLLSLGNFFVYGWLLNQLQQEQQVINQERLYTMQVRMDEALKDFENACNRLFQNENYKKFSKDQMQAYMQTEMHSTAQSVLSAQYLDGYTVYIRDHDHVITNYGVYTLEQYSGLRKSEDYTAQQWTECFRQQFFFQIYPVSTYSYRGANGQLVEKRLVPVVRKSQWNEDVLVVLYMDADKLCKQGQTLLWQGVYLFSAEGEYLYTTDETPLVSHVNQITEEKYSFYVDIDESLYFAKVIPQDQATDVLQSGFIVCLVVAVGALILIAILVPASVRRLMDPVEKVMGILQKEKSGDSVSDAVEQLEHIIRTREKQAKELERRNLELSEYALQSQIKNVYVDVERQSWQKEGLAYILLIQVQYLEHSRDAFSARQAEVENCLQEIMSATLSSLFETTIVFQPEPGQFVARVTLAVGDEDITDEMEQFMQRLRQEEEFAYFIVVQSQPLTGDEEMPTIYNEAKKAVNTAALQPVCQLVRLPVAEEEAALEYTRQQEHKLYDRVFAGEVLQAVNHAEQIIEKSLTKRITKGQIEKLCRALVGTVSRAVAERSDNDRIITAAGEVYTILANQCATATEYRNAVTDYIYTVAEMNQAPKETDAILAGVSRYLQENYHREFSGEEMAAALAVSRSYLSSYYKNKTGLNLSDSIQSFRIDKAKELLKEADVKISDIGPLVGISSSNTFLRQFKKCTGMTPKEYRQQYCRKGS